MAIEVTSVPDPRRIVSFHKLLHFVTSRLSCLAFWNWRVFFRFAAGLLLMTLIISGDTLLRSYKYYSRIIDERLANGYLTSRPGLYAAPRSIQVGQKLSPEKLLNTLRRAGYVESAGSDVWSGSFYNQGAAIEIHPSRTNRKQPRASWKKSVSGTARSMRGCRMSIANFFTACQELMYNRSISRA